MDFKELLESNLKPVTLEKRWALIQQLMALILDQQKTIEVLTEQLNINFKNSPLSPPQDIKKNRNSNSSGGSLSRQLGHKRCIAFYHSVY